MHTMHTRSSDDIARLILRLAVAAIILFHGVAKLTGGIDFIGDMLVRAGIPSILMYGVYIAELVAPLLLILGLFTRLAAAIIAFDMFMAVLLALRDQIGAIKEQGGGWAIELEALLFFASLALVFLGSGRFAVSHGRGKLD
jgi:putative oxidoreductase